MNLKDMTTEQIEEGTLQVMAEDLVNHRIPRALSLKDKMDEGEELSPLEVDYLQTVIEDYRKSLPLLERHPEWIKLATKIADLYSDITEEALENED